jgi:signal transduction histidine kinase
VHGGVVAGPNTVEFMTTIATRRTRHVALAPLRWLVAAIRNSTFVIAGIPVQLAALAALAAPWVVYPGFVVLTVWQVVAAVLASVGLVLLIRAPLTAIERHRCWSLLGLDIARPAAAEGPPFRRLVGSLRSEATWRQLGYHLVIGPALAVGGLLTLASWAGGAGLSVIFGFSYLFPRLSAIQSTAPKTRTMLIAAGLLAVLAAPLFAAAVAWLDRRAAAALLGPSRAVELERRVESLSASRAGVVDAADTERRRIERDLHDGAQQRLVSLAMNLGMARESLTDLPEPARAVIAEAHEEAKAALTELRNLVRGLHPAVLDDRGLDAALSGIAARAPLPVRLSVAVAERVSSTVEAVAYFVVSECLANVARHSSAQHAEIDVRRVGDMLHIRVTDDGVGGASPVKGTGLASLAQRALSVDGTMQIDSPAGGPTVITVELPCGS